MRRAGNQGVGGFLEQLDGLPEQPLQFDHILDQLVGKTVGFDAQPRGRFDQLGNLGQWLGAELARFAFERMRRDHQRGGVAVVHRLLNLVDRLGPVLAKVTEDADEPRSQLGAAALEMHPVDNVGCPVAKILRIAQGEAAPSCSRTSAGHPA